MFIRRYEWEDKCDANRALLKDKEEKLNRIEELEFQLKNSEKHNAEVRMELEGKKVAMDLLKERNEYLEHEKDKLLQDNQKLLEWINKIVEEVGIYEVKDRHAITIPLYKNPIKTYSGDINSLKDSLPEFMSTEEVIIPEIRFIKMK